MELSQKEEISGAWPEDVWLTAAAWAIKNNSLAAFEFLHLRLPWNLQLCALLARRGQLGLLQWVHEQGCPWSYKTLATAAECGHVEIFKWLLTTDCPRDGAVCFNAASNGHLEILKLARGKGFDWSEMTFVCATDHPDVLEWARENGYPWPDRLPQTSAYPWPGAPKTV